MLRKGLLPFACVAALILTACGSPPDKEIHQAQGAIDAAKAIGAAEYAGDELTAAESALKNANDAVTQRDYRLALNHALDARDRAQTSAKQTTERKAQARADAERALTDADRALADLHASLKTAEAARVPPRSLAEWRRAIGGAEQAVQEARTELGRGAYLTAAERAKAAASRAQAVAKEIDPKATAGPRRRR